MWGFLFLGEQTLVCSSRFCFCPYLQQQQQQKSKRLRCWTPDFVRTGFNSLRCRFSVLLFGNGLEQIMGLTSLWYHSPNNKRWNNSIYEITFLSFLLCLWTSPFSLFKCNNNSSISILAEFI